MQKHLLKIMALLVIVGGITLAMPAKASSETETSSGESPICHLRANPNEISIGGGTTLIWWSTGGVVEGKLYPKGSDHLIKTFSGDRGWHWISGIVDTRKYTLVVKNEAGNTADCDAEVAVKEKSDNDNENVDNQGDDSDDSITEVVVKNKKHRHHHRNSKKYKKHKKYRGHSNRKIYKKIKHWKKHNRAKYLQYKAVYKKYKGTSHKKLKKRLSASEYAIYKEYKIYHEYKEYLHYR